MNMQITHQRDESGTLRQIVSARVLRRILRAAGSGLRRPRNFRALDEWDTEREAEVNRLAACDPHAALVS